MQDKRCHCGDYYLYRYIRYADCITFPPFGISYRGHVGRDVIDDQLPPYYLLRPWDIFITPSAEEDIARHEPS